MPHTGSVCDFQMDTSIIRRHPIKTASVFTLDRIHRKVVPTPFIQENPFIAQKNYAYHIILLQNEIQTKYIIKTYIFHLHKMVKRSNFI
jgi:hypothetical protein